ncbi:Pentatricopeptide repeat [Dillenia turbinata]|uniref:Pentatricopeptide repeat n=1 Tax=Dillenia turbinata TaxID=194707 RepID=A0AAN8URJ9_9MAGN
MRVKITWRTMNIMPALLVRSMATFYKSLWLYTFYETKQSAMQSIENGNAIIIKSSASKALIWEATSITSLRKSTTVNGVELLVKSFHHSAVISPEVAGEQSPLACHKEGSVPIRQESERKSSFSIPECLQSFAEIGEVSKAFESYGIMRSNKVQPDQVVFNALIPACGQLGAVDRDFDVLAEMRAETQSIDPDHITVGALIRACSNACQLRGTPEVYTIAFNSCSQTGDWEFVCNVYDDMTRKRDAPDQMFLSTLKDVVGILENLILPVKSCKKPGINEYKLGS